MAKFEKFEEFIPRAGRECASVCGTSGDSAKPSGESAGVVAVAVGRQESYRQQGGR